MKSNQTKQTQKSIKNKPILVADNKAKNKINKSKKTDDVSKFIKSQMDPYLLNLMDPKFSLVTPMLFPTDVHPGNAVTTIPVELSTRYTSFILQPQFNNILEVVHQSSEGEAVDPAITAKKLKLKRGVLQPFWIATDIENSSGKVVVKSKSEPQFGGQYFNAFGGYYNGGKSYPGQWECDGGFTMTFDNISTGSAGTTSVVFQVVTPADNNEGFDVLGDKQGDLVNGGTLQLSVQLNGSYNTLGFRVLGNSSSTITVDMQLTIGGRTKVYETFAGKKFDLFDLPNMKPFLSEFEQASQYSVTAMSFDLINATAILNKAGSVVVAQVPQGSQHLLPANPKELYTYLSSLKSDSSGVRLLSEGLSGSYFPMDLDDTEPKSKLAGSQREYDEHTRPLIAIALDNLNNYGTSLVLELRMAWQYITNSQVTPAYPASGSRAMYMHMVSHFSHSKAYGSSQQKDKRLQQIIKQFENDPVTKRLAREMLLSWKEVTPSALTLS